MHHRCSDVGWIGGGRIPPLPRPGKEKEVAPSPALRTWFNHDPELWVEFDRRYRAELATNNEAVAWMVALANQQRLTLLYAAHDVAHNHAVILAAYLRDHLESDHGRRA